MTRPTLLALLAPVALSVAGCGSPATDNATATDNITVPEGNTVAEIRKLPERQQFGVFLRAIRDGGRDCQEVTAAKEVGAINNAPTWAVTCRDNSRWLVAINADGIATVTNSSELSRLQPKG